MFRILVVDDDAHTRKLRTLILEQYGYEPIVACDGNQALEMLDKYQVDLIILDVLMPKMNGFELTELIRSSGDNVPIIIVSTMISSEDKKKAFRLGIDDYMTKPIDEEKMILRIKALFRRVGTVNENRLQVGNTILDRNELSISTANDKLLLPQKEFYLLYKLVSHPYKIFTRRQIMDDIWNLESESEERTVDVHIKRIREKINQNCDFSILTVRGLGYKVVLNDKK